MASALLPENAHVITEITCKRSELNTKLMVDHYLSSGGSFSVMQNDDCELFEARLNGTQSAPIYHVVSHVCRCTQDSPEP